LRPEDGTPDLPPSDDAGEHEPPRPATWAGRRRAEGANDEPEPAAETEPADEPGGEPDSEPGDEPDSEPGDEPEPEPAAESQPGDEPEPEPAGEPEPEPTDQAQPGEDTDQRRDGLADDLDDSEPEQPEAPTEAADPEGRETVEAETLALADREQAEEAAMAGVRARTADHGVEGGSGSQTPEPAIETPPETPSPEAEDGKVPRAKPLWARFLAASLVIVVSMAAATAISLLVYLTDIAEGLSDNDRLASLREQLTEVDGGDPQTILILGSDKRLDTRGDPGRSDTTILLRVDPEQDAIALLSIPRDLRVSVPKLGVAKFNEAYTVGGPDLTLEVVERLTDLDINHVVNINFTGFADAVNAIGCVYIDVDRRYFIPPESGTAEIDIEAGYQRLCGLKALQYVRFRHDDNDLVRSARQQDFMREARQKLSVGTLVNDRNELLDIFTEYTTSDISDGVTLLELLKTFLAVQSAPVREVHFPADLGDGTSPYVTASEDAIKKAVEQFLGVGGTPGARPGGEADQPPPEEDKQRPDDRGGGGESDDEPKQDFVGPQMDDSTAQGQDYARRIAEVKTGGGDPMVKFGIYYPTRLAPGSTIDDASRAFQIDGPDKEAYRGYKMVVDVPGQTFGNGLFSEYYGVSGTDWVDPPILDNPNETRTIDGRNYLLFYDGDRLRLVGFKTKNAAYWVNNTLLQSLDEGQMLSVATSMREYGD
jgi:polyisoprenyl-teichoic acid--peptidoglycan teichoic acid transferase